MKTMTKLVVFVGALCLSPIASAKVVDLYGQIQGGGMYGKGVAGAQMDADFFNHAAGGSYGAILGAEILWIDGWIEHNQFLGDRGVDGFGLTGTWTQFMLGFDVDFELDSPNKQMGERAQVFGELGLAAGYGVGTGQQVDPPLDITEVSDKGFVGQLSFGVDYRFSKLFSFGVSLPLSYTYMFKNNGNANNEANQYQSVHGSGLLYLRMHLELK